MIQITGVIPLLAAGTSTVLAFIVPRNTPDRPTGLAFAVLATSLIFWNLTFFALYALDDYNAALEYSRLFRTVGVFVLPAILHLTLTLPGRRITNAWRITLAVDYIFTTLIALANHLGLFVTRLDTFYWGYYSVKSSYYHAFTASVVINFSLATYLLVSEYTHTTSPRMRLQLKFWLFGMAVALPLGLTNLLPAYGFRFYPLGNLASALWACIVAYAIVRYRLMDIDILVTKLASYASATVICIVPLTVAILRLERWAFMVISVDFSAVMVLFLIVTSVAFPLVQSRAELSIERWLFRGRYESRVSLEVLGAQIIRTLDKGRICATVCEGLSRALSAGSVALYVRDQAGGRFELAESSGVPARAREFSPGEPYVRWLVTRSEAVLRDEARLSSSQRGAIGAEAVMVENGWEAAVPFLAGQELLGFACLGPRRALQAYTVRDLRGLGVFGGEMATALQNARVYEELRRSRDIINRAGRLSALGTLAAGIAHEIRNPLVSIQTFFQLAPERLDDEEFMSSFLRLAESEVQRISSLIGELLAFAKAPSVSVREVDLNEVVERAIILLEPQAKSQGVRLSSQTTPHLRPVIADPDQVMQVILNIALNGIQASVEGGEVAVETRTVEQEGTSFCQIEVRDSGIGIPEAVKENIFNPFYTTKSKGTGLGLSIANQIINEAGGFILVESDEGRGARFFLHLPVAPSDERCGRAV